ncbi:MAG: hypothetical protein K9M56_04385 [Victivallales bacterium]|nr:hypothetical protein [Victivallales bacterium]
MQMVVAKHDCWGTAAKANEVFGVSKKVLDEFETKGYVRVSPLSHKTKLYNFTHIDNALHNISAGRRPKVHYRK